MLLRPFAGRFDSQRGRRQVLPGRPGQKEGGEGQSCPTRRILPRAQSLVSDTVVVPVHTQKSAEDEGRDASEYALAALAVLFPR